MPMTSRGDADAPSGGVVPPWRNVLRRHLAWLLLLKFAALTLIWALFFGPAHRTQVDAQTAGRQLELGHAAAAAPGEPAAEERRRD